MLPTLSQGLVAAIFLIPQGFHFFPTLSQGSVGAPDSKPQEMPLVAHLGMRFFLLSGVWNSLIRVGGFKTPPVHHWYGFKGF